MLEKKSNSVHEAFFALVRAGLWEGAVNENENVNHNLFEGVDWSEVQRLAEEQSVVGLVAAGIDSFRFQDSSFKIPKPDALQFIGQTLQLEERNKAMNYFIGVIVEKMREAGIFTVLVKGQGVAQCYERPLWRSCGDVDLFFDSENYEKAKAFLPPLAVSVNPEDKRKKHQAMTIDPWVVELHGLMPTEISERINAGVERVQEDIFGNGGVRVWNNDGVEVQLPSPDNDVIIVFTHFLQHFFVGGVGLRQICDWCRLLWTYREELDLTLLEQRLREMGILSEWRAFGAFAVEYLGMPKEAMPMFEDNENEDENEKGFGFRFQDSGFKLSPRLRRQAKRICRVVLDAGNFGHNKDNSYRSKYPRIVEKSITFFRRLGEYARLFAIFPLDAPKFFVTYVRRRVKATIK